MQTTNTICIYITHLYWNKNGACRSVKLSKHHFKNFLIVANLKNIVGIYKVLKHYFQHTTENTKLLQTSRINTTSKKSIHFLLDKTEKNGSYISSLYYVNNSEGFDIYKFDYQGAKYILKRNEDFAEIIKK